MSLNRILLLTLLLSGAGCVPYRLKESPHLTGAVRDEASKRPVPDAALHYEQFPETEIATGPDGRFDFPAIHRWKMVRVWRRDHFFHQHLIVEAEGYLPARRDYGHWGVFTNQMFYLKKK